MRRLIQTVLAALAVASLVACSDLGSVDQGRVVAIDVNAKTVTMIRDVANDTQNPVYTHLPPITYKFPEDRQEMGPTPKAGQRMKLDSAKKQIVIFDVKAQNFRTIDYKQVDHQENVDDKHPLVFDAAAGAAKKFPVIDKAKKTVTVYSARTKILETMEMPEDVMSLPESTWEAGDEIRVYFHKPGEAQRMMNISKTNIFKK